MRRSSRERRYSSGVFLCFLRRKGAWSCPRASSLPGQGTRGRGFSVDAVRRVRLMTATILTATTRCLPNHRRPNVQPWWVWSRARCAVSMPISRSTNSRVWPMPPAPRSTLRMLQERPKPDPATFIGAGKVASLAAACAEADIDLVIFDNELTPAQLGQLEKTARAQGRRSDAADPRHLRPARADARRQVAGRTGAAEIPAAAPGRQRNRTVPPRRRHRHARSW